MQITERTLAALEVLGAPVTNSQTVSFFPTTASCGLVRFQMWKLGTGNIGAAPATETCELDLSLELRMSHERTNS